MAALNKNNSAVKRIMQEAKELQKDPCTDYRAAPLEDDIFEWHCTLRGPSGTEFEGGLYHFRILLPAEYPFRPPSILMLTPNGRFELNTKICISFTNYHEESWQPAWGVRTAILGLQGMFPLKGQAAVGIGSVEYPASERKRLAALSRDWVCPHCQESNLELLPDLPTPTTEAPSSSVTTEDSTAKAESTEAVATSPPPHPQASTDNRNESDAIRFRSTASHSEADHPRSPQPQGLSPASEIDEEAHHAAAIVPLPYGRGRATFVARNAPNKPPVLLDGAICVLLVFVFALICRRMF